MHDHVYDDRRKAKDDNQLFQKRDTDKLTAFTSRIFLNFHPSKENKKNKSNIADDGKF